MKVKFKQIVVEGYRSIVRSLEFNLDRPGLNLVKGTNGMGKTTMFEALVWCIFGINLRETNLNAIISWEEIRPLDWKGTRVMVHVEINTDQYCIIRHLSYKGESYGVRGNDSLMIIKNGELIQGINKDETQKIINKLIGTDAKTFMNSIMFGQRMTRLITQDNKDKRALFEELFDVDWVNIAKRKAELEYAEKIQVISKATYECDNLTARIAMAEEALKRDQRLIEEWGTNQANKILNCKANIVGFETLIKNHNREFTLIGGSPIAYDKEEHDAIEKEYNKITNDKMKWQLEIVKFDNNAKSIQAEINNDGYKAAQIVDKIEKLKKEIEDNKNTIKEAITKKECPTCHQSIKASHHADIKKMYFTEDKEADIVKLNSQMNALNTRLPQLTAALDLQLNAIKRTKEMASESDDRYVIVAARYQELNEIENKLYEISEKQNILKNKIASNEALLENEKKQLKELEQEKAPNIDLKEQTNTIASKKLQLKSLQNDLEDLKKEADILRWWNEKGFGAGGIKAFIFNAMLAQLNAGTRKYGERLGVSLEFSIDLTKASKPFTTICSLGNKLNKDYKDFSGGEEQRLDIVLIFAMYDLISINTNFNILIMDEVFEGLDEDGENAVFDLIRMKADEGKSVYVISHSPILDSLYANTIYFNNNLTTEILH
jgi:DNA repair protein SbcC/Rad50